MTGSFVMWIAVALVLLGMLVAAPRVFGVDPLAQFVGWLTGDTPPRALPDRIDALAGIDTLAALSPLDDIERSLKDLGSHIEAVRGLAEERGAEVERHREGYDYAVTRSFARGVIKAIDLLDDFRAQLDDKYAGDDSPVLRDALTRLEATSGHLELLLESNQIERFVPQAGEAVEDDSRRYDPVEKKPSARSEDHGRVAFVKYPGWVLVTGEAHERVIREAKVCVFGPADAVDERSG